jgi:REP element-mobilizing transposase RayT
MTPKTVLSNLSKNLSYDFQIEHSQQARSLRPLLNEQKETLQTDIFEEKMLWFITFVTHNSRISERMVSYGVETGEPLIFSAEDQLFIAEKIAEAIKRYGLFVITFNVLPDHIHLVILAKTEKELGEYIRKIKGFTSFEFQRSRNWEKGQSIWGQKFNKKPIEDENSLINIIQYIAENHIKHIERWGTELITTWEKGLPEKNLKSLKEIVKENCTSINNLFTLI